MSKAFIYSFIFQVLSAMERPFSDTAAARSQSTRVKVTTPSSAVLSRATCCTQPGQVVIDPKVLRHKAQHAIKPRTFLKRMLSNLKGIYVDRRDAASTLAVLQYLRSLTSS